MRSGTGGGGGGTDASAPTTTTKKKPSEPTTLRLRVTLVVRRRRVQGDLFANAVGIILQRTVADVLISRGVRYVFEKCVSALVFVSTLCLWAEEA